MARDGDDDWLRGIDEAFGSLGLFDEATRSRILQQVQDALSSLDDPDEEGPDVTVLQGGQGTDGPGEDAPHPTEDRATPPRPYGSSEGRPELRVVQGDRQDTSPRSSPEPEVSVRLVNLGSERRRLRRRRHRTHGLRVGTIDLQGDADVWQTVLHASSPATYRIHCDLGELHVASDGELTVRLEAGQSADVEGRRLRVRACGEGACRGRFRRLTRG